MLFLRSMVFDEMMFREIPASHERDRAVSSLDCEPQDTMFSRETP